MSRLRIAMLLVCAALAACSGNAGNDGGQPRDSGSNPGQDAGNPGGDAGCPTCSDAGGGADGGGSDGGVTDITLTPTLPSGTDVTGGTFDVDAGKVWFLYSGIVGGGTVSGIVAVDFGNATLKDIPGAFTAAVAAPNLGKVFVSNGAAPDGGQEIDAIDEQSYALSAVGPTQAPGDFPGALDYDPISKKVYVSVHSPNVPATGYLEVLDATQATPPAFFFLPDAGYGTSTCSFTSSTSCLMGFGEIAADPNGQKVYLLSGDQNSYPMAASYLVSGPDAGTLANLVGGRGAGWYTAATGVALLNGNGTVAVGLSDGGSIVQFLDPGTSAIPAPSTAQSSAVPYGCSKSVLFEASIDAAGNVVITALDETGTYNLGLVGVDQGNGPGVVFKESPQPPGCGWQISWIRCEPSQSSTSVGTDCLFSIVPDLSLCPNAKAQEHEARIEFGSCL